MNFIHSVNRKIFFRFFSLNISVNSLVFGNSFLCLLYWLNVNSLIISMVTFKRNIQHWVKYLFYNLKILFSFHIPLSMLFMCKLVNLFLFTFSVLMYKWEYLVFRQFSLNRNRWKRLESLLMLNFEDYFLLLEDYVNTGRLCSYVSYEKFGLIYLTNSISVLIHLQ